VARLELGWGNVAHSESDLVAFVPALTGLAAVLIRVDLPLGETLPGSPTAARISCYSSNAIPAQFLGRAPSVEPQMQGQGFLLLLNPNTARLTPGQAVTGYLKVSGEPLSGVVVPRDAVVRTEGAGWVYLHTAGGEAFTRVQVPLDYPLDAGWFVTNGLTASDYIVVSGAQQLLSFEQKGQAAE
jgi:hypothetical protein